MRDLNTYIPKLMYYLWEQPKTVATLIENSNIQDIKDHLGAFFTNNFYENILSSYFIEDNLMFVLTLLIKDEISKLNRSNQFEEFLNETPCGLLLTELKRKNDIQIYFKNIIVSAVENLELNYSKKTINFNIADYKEIFERNSKVLEAEKKKSKTNELYRKDSIYLNMGSSGNSLDINTPHTSKALSEQEKFNSKYIPNLDKAVLQEMMNKYKNDNPKMYDYCYLKLNNSGNYPDVYTNKAFLENVYKITDSSILLNIYQQDFNRVIYFIDLLIENLIKNFHFLPYSVKCLCKIIHKLILKKFPRIGDTEKFAFVGNFFFGKLLVPILKNPGIEAFINNCIISRNSLDNLNTIAEILMTFTTGKFYKLNEKFCDYTPFNWYFLEKMPKIFEIYEQIVSVRLPDFIEKLIDDQLPENFKYNYFQENPDELIFHRAICYNLEDINSLLNNMNECKNILFDNHPELNGLKKTLEKLNLNSNKKLLSELRNAKNYTKNESTENNKKKKKDKETEQPQRILYHFLLTSLITNDYYSKLNSIEQKDPHFSIKEFKTIKSDEERIQNNIIKVKNFFCSLLYNYDKLIKTDFTEGTTSNTTQILQELKTLMTSENFVFDGSVPSEWYVNSLLEYLQKIPEDLTKNDCEKLYDEIENDVNKSIKELDFETLSVCLGKMKFARRGNAYYEASKKLLNDIELNEKAKTIIEKEIIPVEVTFSYDEDEVDDIFDIKFLNIKEKKIQFPDKVDTDKKDKRKKIAYTIDAFTRAFPNLVKYQELQDADIFNIIKDLEIPRKLNAYFSYIIKLLEKNNKITKDEIVFINNKIYDYVMNKIYDKIYPYEPYQEDSKIFQQSVRLSWTKPYHFIPKEKNYVFGGFMTDVINSFEMIDKEKSPRKKFLYVKKIFSSIAYLLKFNGKGEEVGVDDQMPILNCAVIKAQPLRLYSNAKYMELFIGEKKNKIEGSQLTQILGICDFIAKINHESLIGVGEKEFITLCNKATCVEETSK